MWYVTFHGGGCGSADEAGGADDKSGKSGVNKVHAYDDDGNLITKDVLPTSIPGVTLCELRDIGFGPDGYLYVANSYSDYSQILRFSGAPDSSGTHAFVGVLASCATVDAIVHPFAFTFDAAGRCLVSSQDTNVVTGLDLSSGAALPIAPYLSNTYPAQQLLPGTFVASAEGKLPNVPLAQPNVPTPQGLAVGFNNGDAGAAASSKLKVASSVRDVLYDLGALFVADEPGGAVKIYDGAQGNLEYVIADEALLAKPVHLLVAGGTLYIGSAGASAVLSYQDGALTPFISGIGSPSGMAFGADGCFYVADRQGRSVLKYDPNGTLLGSFLSGLPDNPEFLLYVPN